MITSRYFTAFLYMIFICLVLLLSSCKDESKQQSKHAFTNDLVSETSPYLLQHAHNPVNWKAWSPDLFEKAQEENKLVLISIGYSSCHWCHVMEKETFEDNEVAKLMNENFVSIKVDREERPDIDEVYQTAAQLQGQNGGWPLNAITLPNGKPLYLGTYHTKDQWMQVLTNVNKQFSEDPQKAAEYADRLAAGIDETNLFTPSSEFEKLTKTELALGIDKWKENWDLELGGDKGREKFPVPNSLDFLLDYAVVTNDQDALTHVKSTLDQMANGGIYDHLGGGFFRYSTDPQWKVPHFEKMLYDNAQLIGLYSKAFKVFKEPIYKDVVFETIAFLNREMKNAEGGYYAALDSESEGEEAKFYIWKEAELQTILGDDFTLFSGYYNIDKKNIWENDQYILYKNGSDETFIRKYGISKEELVQDKKKWTETLMKARGTRVRPNTDDKVLTSWNALLISGFVEAYTAFGAESFLNQAIAVYDFIQDKSYDDRRLKHSYKEGSKRTEGFLEDYAFLSQAAIQLYKVSLNTSYLDFANALMEKTQEGFLDANSGLYRFNDSENLISNIIKTHDGDIPSPNSVMANNLFQLGHINYNVDYSKQSKTMLTTLLPYLTEYSSSYTNWSHLLLRVSHPFYEIAVVGEEAQSKVAGLQNKHIPNTLIVASSLESELPLFEDRFVAGETYIYVCQNRVCKLPVKTVDEALQQLNNF
jgi:uncharacterized protein YyaL (SSP411 family)